MFILSSDFSLYSLVFSHRINGGLSIPSWIGDGLFGVVMVNWNCSNCLIPVKWDPIFIEIKPIYFMCHRIVTHSIKMKDVHQSRFTRTKQSTHLQRFFKVFAADTSLAVHCCCCFQWIGLFSQSNIIKTNVPRIDNIIISLSRFFVFIYANAAIIRQFDIVKQVWNI